MSKICENLSTQKLLALAIAMIFIAGIGCSKKINHTESPKTVHSEEKNSEEDLRIINEVVKERVAQIYTFLFSDFLIKNVEDSQLVKHLNDGRLSLLKFEFDSNEYEDTESNRIIFAFTNIINELSAEERVKIKEIISDREFSEEMSLSVKSFNIVEEKISKLMLSKALGKLGLDSFASKAILLYYENNFKKIKSILSFRERYPGMFLYDVLNLDSEEEALKTIKDISAALEKKPQDAEFRIELCSFASAADTFMRLAFKETRNLELVVSNQQQTNYCSIKKINNDQKSSFCEYLNQLNNANIGFTETKEYCDNEPSLISGILRKNIKREIDSFTKFLDLYAATNSHLYKEFFVEGGKK